MQRRTDSREFFGRIGGEWDRLRRDLFGEWFTHEALLSLGQVGGIEHLRLLYEADGVAAPVDEMNLLGVEHGALQELRRRGCLRVPAADARRGLVHKVGAQALAVQEVPRGVRHRLGAFGG